MIYRERDKVLIRIPGKELQFGDIAFIKAIDYGRLLDTHLCHCPLREVQEWMVPSHFDKYREKPIDNVKFYSTKRVDEETKHIDRPPAKYDNLPSSYGIYDELKTGKEIK